MKVIYTNCARKVKMVQTVEKGGLQEDGTLIVLRRDSTNIYLGPSDQGLRLEFKDRVSIVSFAYDILVNLPIEDKLAIKNHETIEEGRLYQSLAYLIVNEPGFQSGEEKFGIQLEKGSLREFNQEEIVFSNKDAAFKTFLTVLPEGSLRGKRPPLLAEHLFLGLLGTGLPFDEKLHEVAIQVAALREPEGFLGEGDAKILNAIKNYNIDMGGHR